MTVNPPIVQSNDIPSYFANLVKEIPPYLKELSAKISEYDILGRTAKKTYYLTNQLTAFSKNSLEKAPKNVRDTFLSHPEKFSGTVISTATTVVIYNILTDESLFGRVCKSFLISMTCFLSFYLNMHMIGTLVKAGIVISPSLNLAVGLVSTTISSVVYKIFSLDTLGLQADKLFISLFIQALWVSTIRP